MAVLILTVGLRLAVPAEAQRMDLARAAAATLVTLTGHADFYEAWFNEVAENVKGYHSTYSWHTEKGVTFCVIPFGGGGTRLTYDFSRDPFCLRNGRFPRQVEFKLLNVSPEYHDVVWWTVRSDRPGGADANRQADENHKTMDGDTIALTFTEQGDFGYYLAGRWHRSIGKREFRRANPEGGILLVLK